MTSRRRIRPKGAGGWGPRRVPRAVRREGARRASGWSADACAAAAFAGRRQHASGRSDVWGLAARRGGALSSPRRAVLFIGTSAGRRWAGMGGRPRAAGERGQRLIRRRLREWGRPAGTRRSPTVLNGAAATCGKDRWRQCSPVGVLCVCSGASHPLAPHHELMAGRPTKGERVWHCVQGSVCVCVRAPPCACLCVRDECVRVREKISGRDEMDASVAMRRWRGEGPLWPGESRCFWPMRSRRGGLWL
jgi:hypothetical protein